MKSYKKDQRGITHNLLLAGIAVLVLGAIGFAGFRVYKTKNDISAQAAGWTVVGTQVSDNATMVTRACKVLTNTDGRSTYSVRVNHYMYNYKSNASKSKYISFNGVRKGTLDISASAPSATRTYYALPLNSQYAFENGTPYFGSITSFTTC